MDAGDDIYTEDRAAVVQDSEDPPSHRGLRAERCLGVILMPGTAQPGPVEEPLSLQLSESHPVTETGRHHLLFAIRGPKPEEQPGQTEEGEAEAVCGEDSAVTGLRTV